LPKGVANSSEWMTIGLYAPVVIAARLQMLAMEAVKPTAKGRRETVAMFAEKPIAIFEGALAVQAELLAKGAEIWPAAVSAMMFGTANPFLALAATGAGPMSRKVRANARRLSRR
jgi:hypothetical protein